MNTRVLTVVVLLVAAVAAKPKPNPKPNDNVVPGFFITADAMKSLTSKANDNNGNTVTGNGQSSQPLTNNVQVDTTLRTNIPQSQSVVSTQQSNQQPILTNQQTVINNPQPVVSNQVITSQPATQTVVANHQPVDSNQQYVLSSQPTIVAAQPQTVSQPSNQPIIVQGGGSSQPTILVAQPSTGSNQIICQPSGQPIQVISNGVSGTPTYVVASQPSQQGLSQSPTYVVASQPSQSTVSQSPTYVVASQPSQPAVSQPSGSIYVISQPSASNQQPQLVLNQQTGQLMYQNSQPTYVLSSSLPNNNQQIITKPTTGTVYMVPVNNQNGLPSSGVQVVNGGSTILVPMSSTNQGPVYAISG